MSQISLDDELGVIKKEIMLLRKWKDEFIEETKANYEAFTKETQQAIKELVLLYKRQQQFIQFLLDNGIIWNTLQKKEVIIKDEKSMRYEHCYPTGDG